MWILCLLKYIIPKYEIIYSNQRSYGIPNFQKQKIDLKSDTAIISLRLEG